LPTLQDNDSEAAQQPQPLDQRHYIGKEGEEASSPRCSSCKPHLYQPDLPSTAW
jgi:hypothetical protein